MNNLTWQKILECQQKDFVERLKSSLTSRFCLEMNILKSSGYPPLYDNSTFHQELIEVTLISPQDTKINDFFNQVCCLDKYNINKYISYKRHKICEEAVKVYLNNSITEVNYTSDYDFPNASTNFIFKNNININIIVESKTLSKIGLREADERKLTEEHLSESVVKLCEREVKQIHNLSWTIEQNNTHKINIIIFVLFLDWRKVNKINNNSFDCIICGFKPIKELAIIQSNQNKPFSIKIENLFYAGGLRAYLESLT